MGGGKKTSLTPNRTDLVQTTTVQTTLFVQNHIAHGAVLHIMEVLLDQKLIDFGSFAQGGNKIFEDLAETG